MKKLQLEQHEFDVLKAMVDERFHKLELDLKRCTANLDEYESNIKNYTTYDLHVKLMGVNS